MIIIIHLVIVNTGKGHADLSEEYSEIPMEMKEAAKAAGAELLCETTLEKVLANMDKIDNDRAILRAIHFFKENERVERAAKAVEEKDGETVLSFSVNPENLPGNYFRTAIRSKHIQSRRFLLRLLLQISSLRNWAKVSAVSMEADLPVLSCA